jgi:hypothetical protein
MFEDYKSIMKKSILIILSIGFIQRFSQSVLTTVFYIYLVNFLNIDKVNTNIIYNVFLSVCCLSTVIG